MIDVAVGLVVRLLATLLFALLGAWPLMLLIGVVHAELLPAVFPLGYGKTYFVALLLGWTLTLLNFTPDGD